MLRNKKGMTLIEIMIVMIILAGLMAFLGKNVMTTFLSSKVKTTKIAMGEVIKSLDQYYADCNTYPTSLESLSTKPSDCPNWGPEPYLRKQILDSWNKEFIYEPQGTSFILKSLGADGREGGDGSNEDITSDKL